MEQKPPEVVKALTPDIAGPSYGQRPFVDFRKHMPWLKNFEQCQPPADHTIVIGEEKTK